jgi:hypothetical protein
MQIEEFRTRLELFHEALHRRLYLFYSGKRSDSGLSDVFSEYSDLFSDQAIEQLRHDLETTGAVFQSRRVSLQKLLAFAIEQNVARACCALFEELQSAESRARVHWGPEEISLGALPSRLAAEPDPDRRRRLDDLRRDAAGSLQSLRHELHDQACARLRSLGYASCIQGLEACSGLNWRGLSASLTSVLDGAESEYKSLLNGSFSATVGADRAIAHVPYWIRRHEPQNVFAAGAFSLAMEQTIRALGIEPEAAGGLSREEPPDFAGLAACIPIRAPGEIRIISSGAAGSEACRASLHANGRAHHFAWTGASLPAEHRLLGDGALPDAFGALFEHRLLSGRWLRARLGFEKPEGFLSFQRLLRAYKVRRCAALLQFQISLCGPSPPPNPGEAYADIMTEMTGVRHEADDWLSALDRPFEAPRRLTAWVFESMLEEHLRLEFGSDWDGSRSAGGFLKEIWETGQLYSVERLAREIGLGPLDPQALGDALRGSPD